VGTGTVKIAFHPVTAKDARQKVKGTTDDLFSNPNAATNSTMIAKVEGLPVTGDVLRVFVNDELAAVATPIDSLYFNPIKSESCSLNIMANG
jgi:hypothetical protein